MDSTLLSQLQAILAGEYEILRELGGAGMSRVFVARQLQLARDVVIKVLPPDLAAGIKVERFQREIQLAARLQHPHIVPVLSAGLRGGILYYTMPYVNGPSLGTRLKETEPLTVVDATSILRDVADALSYAHGEGVIHRDVKPQNILLNAHHAVVVDFGVAKAISEAAHDSTLTATGLALGTPMYMAPEQALADPGVDERADIYSLGVVAYEIFTRRAPFSAASPQAMMAAHVTSTPRPINEVNPSLPEDLAHIVMRCLEKDPTDRWRSAEELCEALNDFGARFTPSRRVALNAQNVATAPARDARAPVKATGGERWYQRVAGAGWRRIGIAFAALAVLVAGATFYRSRHARPAAAQQSLAVLPFDNASGNDLQWFADGMTEEVITRLVRIDGLVVVPPSSSFAFKDVHENPRTIGRRLGARHVLVGAVRRAGGRLRITARLVSVSDGAYSWSNSYEGNLDDVFDVQKSIARDIASGLELQFSPRAGQPLDVQSPKSIGAYDLFLKGNAAARQYSQDSLRSAIEHYRAALAIDTGYARAYAGIANAYYLLADDFWEPKKTYPLVRENALHALQLDASLADAYASLGSYEVSYGWNWDAAKANAERAIALNPSSSLAHTILAWYYVTVGKVSDAIREGEIASSLDPYSYPIGANVVSMLRAAGRHDLAMVETRRLMQSAVGDTTVMRAWLSWDEMLSGDLTAARIQLDSAIARNSECCKRTRALFYALTGDAGNARQMLDAFIGVKKANGLYYRADWIAEIMAALDDRNATFSHLEQAYEDRSLGLPVFASNTIFRRYESDPRFADLKHRLRLQ